MRNRRNSNSQNITQMLIVLICVLSVILAGVLCLALLLEPERPDDNETTPSDTLDPGTQGPTDAPSKPTDYIGLTMTGPEKQVFTTLDREVVFTGHSDPASPLTVNGQEVSRDADGSFQYTAVLESGENGFLFEHKGEKAEYTIEYRYVVEYYRPGADQTYNCGATVYFEVSARTGSTVTAAFNGQTVALYPAANQTGTGVAEGFTLYAGTYALPSLNTTDLDLGQIVYTAVCDGVTEVYSSGTITCLKSTQVLGSDPSVTPAGGTYKDVGSGYICEIINYSGETYNAFTVDDTSHPNRNYLPEGTLDYCSTERVFFEVDGEMVEYVNLRCGRRLYVKKNNPPYQKTQVVDCYIGTLPDHNEIGVASMENTGRYTVLTLDTLWKAPFYFEFSPQQYNVSGERFPVNSCSYSYIDITFCYATEFEGMVEISPDDPLFSHAELIRRDYDCTLRLHLKKSGTFYGWDAYYNEAGQLCFKFLNPAKVTLTDNAYGVDLTGVRVMIDVGHGGVDGGASKYDAGGILRKEADCNLTLALKVKEELESIGATVLLNRSDDQTVSVDERILLMRNSDLDYLIAIHHNSSGAAGANGFEAYYYSAHNKLLADLLTARTEDVGAYQSVKASNWHVYYMGRQSYCPSVLTENGYMSNPADLSGALDPEIIEKKAQALAQGIADYFMANNPA